MISRNFIKRAASLGMALLLLVGTLPGAALADDTEMATNTVKLKAELRIKDAETSDAPSGASEISDKTRAHNKQFSFKLEPDQPEFPMPDNPFAHVNGEGVAEFDDIVYNKEGHFTYTVHQVSSPNDDYTYDETVYEISVRANYVDGELLVTYSIYPEGSDSKTDIMLFTNTYTEPEPEPEPEPSEEPSPSPEPSEEPTPEPSTDPTPEPTTSPSPSPEPSYEPTPTPSTSPSPSPEPSTSPSPEPSEEPTPEPSEEPTPEPSEEPEPGPSEEPAPEESEKPEWRHDDEPIKVPPDHEPPVIMDELPNPNDPDAPNYVTIFEDGVPLTFMKTEDPETGEMIYVLIEDEEVPQNDSPDVETEYTDGSPKTGDETNNTRWFVLIGAAAVGAIACVAWLVVPKKRRR
jgi:pilin isopeptide linkage protein